MLQLKHLEGASAASWQGHEFIANAEGIISVPAHAVADLASHGWRGLEELVARSRVALQPAAAAPQSAAEVQTGAAVDPVEHLFANLDKVSEDGIARLRARFAPSMNDAAMAVLNFADSMPAELVDRFKEKFAPPAVDPIEGFLAHLKTLDVPSIDAALEAVIPKVKGIMDEKAPPAPPAPPAQPQQDQQPAAANGAQPATAGGAS